MTLPPQDILISSSERVANMLMNPEQSSFLIEMAKAVQEERERELWQDISTAPWDGTDILVCVTHNTSEGEWETLQWVDWRVAAIEWPVYDSRIDIPFPPTRWQPLPAPPKQKEITG